MGLKINGDENNGFGDKEKLDCNKTYDILQHKI